MWHVKDVLIASEITALQGELVNALSSFHNVRFRQEFKGYSHPPSVEKKGLPRSMQRLLKKLAIPERAKLPSFRTKRPVLRMFCNRMSSADACGNVGLHYHTDGDASARTMALVFVVFTDRNGKILLNHPEPTGGDVLLSSQWHGRMALRRISTGIVPRTPPKRKPIRSNELYAMYGYSTMHAVLPVTFTGVRYSFIWFFETLVRFDGLDIQQYFRIQWAKWIVPTMVLFPCNIMKCIYVGKSQRALCDHMALVHPKKKKHQQLLNRPFKCAESCCDFRSMSAGGLRKHLVRVHPLIKPFLCDWCEYKSTSGAGIRKHKSRDHPLMKNKTREVLPSDEKQNMLLNTVF